MQMVESKWMRYHKTIRREDSRKRFLRVKFERDYPIFHIHGQSVVIVTMVLCSHYFCAIN